MRIVMLAAHVTLLGWLMTCLSAAPLPLRRERSNKYNIRENQQNYLSQFGYAHKSSQGINLYRNSEDLFLEAIKRLQKFAGLNVTGEVDNATKALMSRPRCHLPDGATNNPTLVNRIKRFVLISRYISTYLTWNVGSYPDNSLGLTDSDVNRILAKSFGDWSQHAPLYFQQSSYGPRINIGFLSLDHGDGFSFDGPGGILAHAFFPEDGRLHFDDAEAWSDESYYGTNLRSVATHEIGHILGLGHSADPNAVMSPYYLTYNAAFALQSDDIHAIQLLYGKNEYAGTTFRTVSTNVPLLLYTSMQTTTTTPTPYTIIDTTTTSTASPIIRTTPNLAPKPWLPVGTPPINYYTTPTYRYFTTPYYPRYTTPPPGFWNFGKK